jgi:hypothetical protein
MPQPCRLHPCMLAYVPLARRATTGTRSLLHFTSLIIGCQIQISDFIRIIARFWNLISPPWLKKTKTPILGLRTGFHKPPGTIRSYSSSGVRRNVCDARQIASTVPACNGEPHLRFAIGIIERAGGQLFVQRRKCRTLSNSTLQTGASVCIISPKGGQGDDSI